jgi:hypothetical protein
VIARSGFDWKAAQFDDCDIRQVSELKSSVKSRPVILGEYSSTVKRLRGAPVLIGTKGALCLTAGFLLDEQIVHY